MIRLIIILLLLSACSIQRQSNKRQSIQRLFRQEWKQDLQVQQKREQDSSQFQMLILPKDSFSFSLIDGFKGKAHWIYWEGLQQHSQQFWDSQVQHIEKQSQSNIKQKALDKKVDQSIHWKIGIFVAILVISFIIILFYKIKK